MDGYDDVWCDLPTPIDYAESANAGWFTRQVTGDGDRPLLGLARDGTPHVVFSDRCGSLGEAGLYTATPDHIGGPFVREPIPGTRSGDNMVGVASAMDDAGWTHLLYQDYSDGSADRWLYLVSDDGAWTEPVEPLPGRAARQMAVDGYGTAHFLAQGSDGIWHAANATGAFTFDEIAPDLSAPFNPAALALDGDGRPHVLFETGDGLGGPIALWYGVLSEP